MKTFVAILVLSLIGLVRINCSESEEYVLERARILEYEMSRTSIDHLFEQHIYGITLATQMGVLYQCEKLHPNSTMIDDIYVEYRKFNTCFRAMINDIIAKYKTRTSQYDESSLESSQEYPIIMCEYYTGIHACAKDFAPMLSYCLSDGNNNTFNLMYQGVKYAIDLVCDNNAEMAFKYFAIVKDYECIDNLRDQILYKVEKFTKINEEVLFSSEASCMRLLDFLTSLRIMKFRSCNKNTIEVINGAAPKLWTISGCDNIVNINEVFNNRL